MTPKEKAIDLIKLFENDNLNFEYDILYWSKIMAIRCVQEIINSCKDTLSGKELYKQLDYYNDVKGEISRYNPDGYIKTTNRYPLG